ncbi:MAG: hypothetical protein ACJ790_01990 [Myxococcaceae bacterium]
MAGGESGLHVLAAKQHGVVSREQVMRAGVSAWMIRARLSSGSWKELFPAAYVLGGAPPTWQQTATAALIWAGPDAALSHRSSAFVQGWLDRSPSRLEITIPKSRNLRSESVKVYRSDLSIHNEVKVYNGLRVTDAPRTLIDLSSEKDLERLVELAIHLRPYVTNWTRRRLKEMGRTTSKGIARLRAVLAGYHGDDRPTDSLLETKFRTLLRKHRIGTYHHYAVLGRDGEWILESDFAWPEKKVVCECDGRKFHDNPRAFDRRAEIQAKCAAAGWRLIPVTWNRVTKTPEELVRDIKEALAFRETLKV